MLPFNQYLEQLHLNKDLIFDLDSHTSYAKLIEDAYSFSFFLKKNDFKKIGILTHSPLDSMMQILGSIMAEVDVILLSKKEPESALLKLKTEFKLDALINHDQFFNTQIFAHDFKTPLDHLGLNVLSSGSSGKSKEIFLSLTNLFSSADNFIRYFSAAKKDIFLANLPHHHVGGLMVLWRAFFSGASITMTEESHPDYISLVPLQLQRLLSDEKKISNLQNKKCILIGGAPFDETLKLKAKQLKLNIYETYGMSETASFIMLNQEVLDGIEVRLTPEGLIQIKGAVLSKSAPLDSAGFFTTKDQGEQIGLNKFKFIKRTDIQFKSAGELINPLEVEEVLLRDPRIKDAISVCVPHYKWTNAQAAVINTETECFDSFTEELRDDLKNQLHPFLIPALFFKAPDYLLTQGLKPKRYFISNFAHESFLKTLFHFEFIDKQKEKTMVVFHGFMEDLSDFDFFKTGVENFNLLLIDLPGHGKTKVSSFSSQAEIYFYLKSLITLYAKKPILYGYSMGARVAIELVHRGLEVDSLLFESAGLGLETQSQKDERLVSDLELFTNINSKEQLRDFLLNWYDNPIFTNYKQTFDFEINLARKLEHDHQEWQKALAFFSPGASSFLLVDTLLKLKNLKITAITGKLDTRYDQLFLQYAQLLENCTHLSLESVGHNPHKIIQQDILKIINHA